MAWTSFLSHWATSIDDENEQSLHFNLILIPSDRVQVISLFGVFDLFRHLLLIFRVTQRWKVLETQSDFTWEFVASLVKDGWLVFIDGLVEDVEICGKIGERIFFVELNVMWSILNYFAVSRPDYCLEWENGSDDEIVSDLAFGLIFFIHVFNHVDMLALAPFVLLGKGGIMLWKVCHWEIKLVRFSWNLEWLDKFDLDNSLLTGKDITDVDIIKVRIIVRIFHKGGLLPSCNCIIIFFLSCLPLHNYAIGHLISNGKRHLGNSGFLLLWKFKSDLSWS